MKRFSDKYISIKNARVNNLRNISIDIPRNKLIVITGVSGSGKSSLAFDTLYAEGQRRYIESLSSYARQFLGRMNKPECDYIKGLPPAIAIEQKVISRNPRSTVGTSTEIYEYLRLLYARIGHTFSPISGEEVKKHSEEDVINVINTFAKGTKFAILSPIIVSDNRTLDEQMTIYLQQGYSRVFMNDDFMRIESFLEDYDKYGSGCNDIYLLIDRLSVDDSKEAVSRLVDSLETAMYEGNGACRITFLPSNISYDFSERFEADGMTFQEPNDNMFSFHSPIGACPRCEGFGNIIDIDERLVIPNSSLSVWDGCVQCWHGEKMGEWKREFCRRAEVDKFPIFQPYYSLSKTHKEWLWHGLPSERHLDLRERVCIDSFFQMVKENQYKIQYRVMLSRYRGKTKCTLCNGKRLKKEVEYVLINGKSITNLIEMPISTLRKWFEDITLSEHDAKVGKRLLTEIKNRLKYLEDVGLGYLTLNRQSNTLSGGESQRINLTTAIGSSLVGSLYILDEPSIGLHSRDTEKLIAVLRNLQALGNTVVIVEHDEEIMRAADYLIDIGPNAGRLGGEIVFEGETSELQEDVESEVADRSHTIKYLLGNDTIPLPYGRRKSNMSIVLKGARMNNLRGIDVTFPLNVITVVTGVSGSGKSSLINGTLYPILKRKLDEVADIPGDYSAIEGDWQQIQHVECIDQNPIGKSMRSNPVTYIKAFDDIRQLFAEQPLSQQMGFSSKYFSFNTDGGRCEQCKGAGSIVVEMQFMADLILECEACHGKRFNKEVLDVLFKNKSINDILEMTVDEAIEFFESNNQTHIASQLEPLREVGLGYIKLGQSSSTLSGGENQRVKLAYYIGQEKSEPTLFIFDEPTTGLHFHDIKYLLKAFDKLIEHGHTVIIIEHNLDVIKCADYIIDLGPDGGDKGGHLVFEGTPEELIKCKNSYTADYLKMKL